MHYTRYLVLWVLLTVALSSSPFGLRPLMEYFWYIVLAVFFKALISGVCLTFFFTYLKESQVAQMFEEQPYTGRAQPRARATPFPG